MFHNFLDLLPDLVAEHVAAQLKARVPVHLIAGVYVGQF